MDTDLQIHNSKYESGSRPKRPIKKVGTTGSEFGTPTITVPSKKCNFYKTSKLTARAMMRSPLLNLVHIF
jgi:hypothetical protein